MNTLMKKLLVLGICAGAFLALSVQGVWATGISGSGGEPGGNCPDSDTIDYEYAPPPFTGTITATWVPNASVCDGPSAAGICISTNGLVSQVGPSQCKAEIANEFYKLMTLDDFKNLTPGDIQGDCLPSHYIAFFVDQNGSQCLTEGYIDVVGAGNLKFSTDVNGNPFFTVDVVLMPVHEKLSR